MLTSHETVCCTMCPQMSEKEIVKKLLGRSKSEVEADSDDESSHSLSSSSVGVTGEQGGRLLACFLVRAKKQGGVSFLADGVEAFLIKQVPKVALYPGPLLLRYVWRRPSSSSPSSRLA